MTWFESTGAATIYGVAIGGALTGTFSLLNDKRAERIATAESKSRSHEAELERKHQQTLDDRRATREMRQGVYPVLAESAQESANKLKEAVAAALAGDYEALDFEVDVPEWSRAVASISVFGSGKTVLAWNAFLSRGITALSAAKRLKGGEPDGTGAIRKSLESVRIDIEVRLNALLESMRMDLIDPI